MTASYMESFYDRRRFHSALGHITPNEKQQPLAAAAGRLTNLVIKSREVTRLRFSGGRSVPCNEYGAVVAGSLDVSKTCSRIGRIDVTRF
jgi:hypothetical protein